MTPGGSAPIAASSDAAAPLPCHPRAGNRRRQGRRRHFGLTRGEPQSGVLGPPRGPTQGRSSRPGTVTRSRPSHADRAHHPGALGHRLVTENSEQGDIRRHRADKERAVTPAQRHWTTLDSTRQYPRSRVRFPSTSAGHWPSFSGRCSQFGHRIARSVHADDDAHGRASCNNFAVCERGRTALPSHERRSSFGSVQRTPNVCSRGPRRSIAGRFTTACQCSRTSREPASTDPKRSSARCASRSCRGSTRRRTGGSGSAAPRAKFWTQVYVSQGPG